MAGLPRSLDQMDIAHGFIVTEPMSIVGCSSHYVSPKSARVSNMKKTLVDQLRHVDATPKVLNDLESTVVGAVRHLYEVADRAAKEIERLEQENRALKKLCKSHGIAIPSSKR
jgi:hypothetical protein